MKRYMRQPTTQPGYYNIYKPDGTFVTWYSTYKDAKRFVETNKQHKLIAVKVLKEKEPETSWAGDWLKLEDGSLVPFTKANLKKYGK